MDPDKQRIAIAEACGYKGCLDPNCDWRKCFHLHKGEMVYFPEPYSIPRYPDYLLDLNAMHEAEKTFNGNHQRIARYQDALIKVIGVTGFGPFGTIENWLLHATAAQRAEAFLRTIGKWEES